MRRCLSAAGTKRIFLTGLFTAASEEPSCSTMVGDDLGAIGIEVTMTRRISAAGGLEGVAIGLEVRNPMQQRAAQGKRQGGAKGASRAALAEREQDQRAFREAPHLGHEVGGTLPFRWLNQYRVWPAGCPSRSERGGEITPGGRCQRSVVACLVTARRQFHGRGIEEPGAGSGCRTISHRFTASDVVTMSSTRGVAPRAGREPEMTSC